MESVVTKNIILRESKHGNGIFTGVDLKKNSILFKIAGSPVDFSETLKMGEKECYCLQVGMKDYIIPDYPFLFSNHSCNPNCGINENLAFIALEDIKEGGELVWDYSTSMLERNWTMKCDCGSPDCRQMIEDFDLLPASVKLKYLNKKIVLPYIINNLLTPHRETNVVSMVPPPLSEAIFR